MSLHHSCPNCHALLVIADGCEGRSTRCPGCLAQFVVPGATAQEVSAELVCAVMTPLAGTVTQHDLDAARSRHQKLSAENVVLQIELTRQRRRRQRQAARVRALELFQSGREMLDHSFGRTGGLFVALAIVPAVLVLLTSVFSPSALGYLLIILVGVILAAATYLPFSFYPEDNVLAAALPPATEKLAQTTTIYERLVAEESLQRERMSAAEAEYRRLQTAIDSRLHWLRTCQWQAMTGRGFANFVGLALEEQGCSIEPADRADAWRGLFVVRRGDTRLAVLAKADGDRPIDVDAVEQGKRAMAFHGCRSAVVVTNSHFTAPAKELAATTGCKLVEASQIPDFIEGRIAF
jgi:hypothetical protein